VNLMVRATLPLYVVPYGLLVAILANRVGIESACPEFSSPEHLFHLRVAEKDFLCGYAFCNLDYGGWGQLRHALYQKMDMVLVCAYLYEMHLVPLPYPQTYIRQCALGLLGKHLPAILGRADEVVKQQRFIVSPKDMLTHTAILPRSRASRNPFD